MKNALIISGGSLDLEFAAGFLKEHTYDMVIAVDSGLQAALELGISVHTAVGDFDSVDPEVYRSFQNQKGILWDIHKPEKDETDTELAVTTALKAGCQHITMLGALGGRFDHALGNIHLLYYIKTYGAEGEILDSQNRITILMEGRRFCREKLWGKYVSFLPLTFQVTGITLQGFRYPLYKRDISIGPCLCISNELSEEEAVIQFEEGVLICVESKDKTGLEEK